MASKASSSGSRSSTDSSTSIKALDTLLQGGFPRGSTVLLAGSSGSGKTIFCFQWLFNGAHNNENGLYITLTETPEKSRQNLEKIDFYDARLVEQGKVRIVDLRATLYEKQFFNRRKIFEFLETEIKKTRARRLCIDSVTAIAYNLDDRAKIRDFIFELGKLLTRLDCTSILTSEVADGGKFSVYGVEEFISDVIVRLDQRMVKGESHRTLRLVKVRGKDYIPQDLSFKLSNNGIVLFPRIETPLSYPSTNKRISTGSKEMDKMLNGGIFMGSSTLFSGGTGTGKSLFSLQFIMDGLKKGEPCLYAGFEESRSQILRNAQNFGWDLETYEKNNSLVLRCVYPDQKLTDEHIAEITDIIERKKIKRCAVDSLSAIGNSVSQEEYMEFMRRLNAYLKMQNVSTFFTSTVPFLTGEHGVITGDHISTMIDNIIVLRHVEVEGRLKLIANIVKVRASDHSKDLREYRITGKGIILGESLAGYEGILTGVTRKITGTVSAEDLLKSNLIRSEG